MKLEKGKKLAPNLNSLGLYHLRKDLGFAQPFHVRMYSTRGGLMSQHEVLRSKTTSLSV